MARVAADIAAGLVRMRVTAGFPFWEGSTWEWELGRLQQGVTVVRSARFLGRSFDYGYVVTCHKLDRLVEMRVERPFPMVVRYELDDATDGTSVAIHAVGTPGRFFGWATPLITRQVRRSMTSDLVRLRHYLET